MSRKSFPAHFIEKYKNEYYEVFNSNFVDNS